MEFYNNESISSPKNNFASASLILGVCSLILLCTGVFSIPLGALGILFAVLSRKSHGMSSSAKVGCAISSFGLIFGLFLSISTYLILLFTIAGGSPLQNPGEYNSSIMMDELLQKVYGPEYEDLLENSLGIDSETLQKLLGNP